MVNLREMNHDDLTAFQQWLHTPHVAKWYHNPLSWIEEIEKQDCEFNWIHHYMVEYAGILIGFCQYYACKDSDETWEGYTEMGGSYSIDYLIGETAYLGRGFGKQLVLDLLKKIKRHDDAVRIVVQPEPENKASCGLLLTCGFELDTERGIFVKAVKALCKPGEAKENKKVSV